MSKYKINGFDAGNKKTKIYMVYEYMMMGNSITSMEAFRLFKATRLSAIIYDLKNTYGVPIETEYWLNSDGNGRYASYWIPKY